MHLQAIVMVFQEHLYLQANTQAFKPKGMFYSFLENQCCLNFFEFPILSLHFACKKKPWSWCLIFHLDKSKL